MVSREVSELRVCKLGEHNGNNVVVVQSLVIRNDFTWSLTVHGVEVDGESCSSLSMFRNPLAEII